jgi:hypothetical protein
MQLEFSRQIFEKYQNTMKIRAVGAEVFHADRHDEVDSSFLEFGECA